MTWQSVIGVLAATVTLAGCAGDTVSEAKPEHCSPASTRVPCTSARIGVEYPMAVASHCGVGSAYFDGRYWVIDPTQPEGANEIYGVMTLVDPSLLDFTGEDFRYVFKPAPASYSPPGCM